MNKASYKYLLNTFGRNPWLWVGWLLEIINILIVRVYVVIVVAQAASHVAAGNVAAAKADVLHYFIAYVLGSLIGTAGDLLCLHTENNEYSKLSESFHRLLVGKDMAFFRSHQTGYLASLFRQHLDGVMLLARFLRGEALGVAVSLVVPAAVLLVANLKVGLIACAVVILQVLYIYWSSSKANTYRHRAGEVYRKLTGEVADEMTNIVAFKSAGVEDTAHNRIVQLIRQENNMYWLRQKVIALLDLPRGIVTAAGTAAAMYVIVAGASSHDPQALGLIVLTLTYMFQILRNVAAVPGLIFMHDDYITKLYPTLEYLQSDDTIRDPDQPVPFEVSTGAIDITDMSFSYTSSDKNHRRIKVFDKLSLHIDGGEQVGIVGLSGAGKSTLANLMLRFDEIDSGSISIDGIDIRDVRQNELRQKIAYVPQEPLLFHRSVRENIAYYDENVSDTKVIEAAKAAHADEFIRKLPEGYGTTVGERGVKLSGGQKQRVAIARAVLKKAPIMIFDEATSALDSESEQIIQRALPEILGRQTALIVAHRLSTVAGLDRIIVMHEGNIIEEGTHTQLLKQKGRYYSLWQKQTSRAQD